MTGSLCARCQLIYQIYRFALFKHNNRPCLLYLFPLAPHPMNLHSFPSFECSFFCIHKGTIYAQKENKHMYILSLLKMVKTSCALITYYSFIQYEF